MRIIDWLLRREKTQPDHVSVDPLLLSSGARQPSGATVVPVKVVPRSGDAFVDSCFSLGFEEFTDNRNWSDMPEAAGIPSAANRNDLAKAATLAEELRQALPDFYFSYYWLASLACERGYSTTPRYAEARRILDEGLRRSNRKTELCRKRADIEWAARDVSQAIVWWSKHAVLQVSTRAEDETGFLYLSHVAEAVGLPAHSRRLLQHVDRIVSGGMRLNRSEADDLSVEVKKLPITESVRKAIELLDRAFLQ